MTTSTTTTLATFIADRLAEDEAAARAAQGLAESGIVISAGDAVEHIARHDPARVLAQVAALRAVVELHRPLEREGITLDRDEFCKVDCTECGGDGTSDDYWPCPTLRTLASIWADHEDFDAGWA